MTCPNEKAIKLVSWRLVSLKEAKLLSDNLKIAISYPEICVTAHWTALSFICRYLILAGSQRSYLPFALKHADIQVADNPKRLLLTVSNGKTGYRNANSMEGAVPVYKRIKERNPNAKGEDYSFLPNYKNQQTAAPVLF